MHCGVPEAATIELLLFKDVDDDNPDIIKLSSSIFKSTYYWHVKVRGLKAGQVYAYRITKSVYDSRQHASSLGLNKVLIDPYAKRVLFPKFYNRFDNESLRYSAKSVVVDTGNYDWGIDVMPHHSLESTIIYEMHVKGFTADTSSKLDDSIRGTYRGLIEKIPYLEKIGITAVELMPVYQFDAQDARPGMTNYWGYSPMSFFCPHEQFSSDKSVMGPLNEFRDMVKALHRHGIEVILDVVYNHTSEGNENGPTYCFKGFDKDNYYIIKDGFYQNYSGCGNTLNANKPVVRNLIINSLVFWHEVMHVDGFRFDLASILSRDKNGMPMYNNSTLMDIDANPKLAEAKIIAEPWDAGGLYQLGSISGYKWREWNGQFRDDVRSFMRGDQRMVKRFATRLLGSPDIYNDKKTDPRKSVNFITCHDGFTLWDLVCYSEKHNLSNGENNADGNNCNYSANYGIEGETDDMRINQLRLRQAKNFMTLTMLSIGTPMICMGDEVLRTQKGNNNAYCQDNPISYFNWDFTPIQQEMLKFTSSLIRYSKIGQIKRRNRPEKNLNNALRSAKLQWHGVIPYQPDWSDQSHSIGILIYYMQTATYAYVFVNAYWEDLTIEIPPVPVMLNKQWYRFIDTSKGEGEDVTSFYMKLRYNAGDKIKVKSRSILMLLAPPQ